MTETPLLSVDGLGVDYPRRGLFAQPVTVIDDVSFTVGHGRTVALVGESGAGKSTIGRAILGLAPISRGDVRVGGRSLTGPEGELAREQVQAVFQDPYGSLNPSRTIGATLREPLEVHHRLSTADAKLRIRESLSVVGLPPEAADRLPRGFSGGQRQRIGIARALTVEPSLVVCDEATSALDVVTRARVVDLLRRMQRESGVAYLFITHDLPLVASFADHVVVLYRGRVMEQGPAALVCADPRHPYTQALLTSVPVTDPDDQARRRAVRRAIRLAREEAGDDWLSFPPVVRGTAP